MRPKHYLPGQLINLGNEVIFHNVQCMSVTKYHAIYTNIKEFTLVFNNTNLFPYHSISLTLYSLHLFAPQLRVYLTTCAIQIIVIFHFMSSGAQVSHDKSNRLKQTLEWLYLHVFKFKAIIIMIMMIIINIFIM